VAFRARDDAVDHHAAAHTAQQRIVNVIAKKGAIQATPAQGPAPAAQRLLLVLLLLLRRPLAVASHGEAQGRAA
jgi:hypothetical protein